MIESRRKRQAVVLSLTMCTLGSLALSADARVKLEKSVEVDADKDTVWTALMDYQKAEKTFNRNAKKVSVKEQFAKVPVVGSTYIDYEEQNFPGQKICYRLTDSKVLNRFEGEWRIEDSKDGKGTLLKLTTDIDSWMPVPLKNKILKNFTAKGMDKRMTYVKKHAEQLSAGSSVVPH